MNLKVNTIKLELEKSCGYQGAEPKWEIRLPQRKGGADSDDEDDGEEDGEEPRHDVESLEETEAGGANSRSVEQPEQRL